MAALAVATWLIGCAIRKDSHPLAWAPGPVYDTPERILGMPACHAKVIERGPCYLYLRTNNGQGFYLGSPGSDAEVGRFLDVLEDGQAYRFPETFLKHKEQHRDSSKP